MVIRRVSPISLAKVVGLLYAILGLVFGAFMSLIFTVIGAGAPEGMHSAPFVGMMFGAGAIVILPLFYGVMGFVGAGLAALIYNGLAGMIGGVEIEVDAVAPSPRV
jgi:hypothetical protein